MIVGSNAGNANGMNIDNTNATGTANTIFATNANVNSPVTSPTTGGGTVIFARKGAALANAAWQGVPQQGAALANAAWLGVPQQGAALAKNRCPRVCYLAAGGSPSSKSGTS